MKHFFLIFALVCLSALTSSYAQAPSSGDLEREARVAAISKTLRCVVCQNQSIYDSNAPLAEDMRRLVEKRVLAGDSDDEVRDYLRERYGDYVLMTPPLQSNTLLLWLGPLMLLLLAGTWFIIRVRRRTVRNTPNDLSDEDRARARAALFGGEDDVS